MVGKISYLLESNRASPEEILVLAYNSTVQEEIKERVKKKIGKEIDIKTFHSLGISILKDVKGESAKVSNFAGDSYALDKFLKSTIDKLLNDESFRAKMLNYFFRDLYAYRDEINDFKDLKEYKSWVKRNNFVTFNSEKVKSLGEVIIANFLYSNGIEYNYESQYKSNTQTPYKGSYKPDFYLPDIDLYIEYYGIDEEGNTKPGIDKEEYNKQIIYKREVHRTHNTKIEELYFYDFKKQQLISKLEQIVKIYNLKTKKKTSEELLKVANKIGHVDKFTKLVSSFLALFKSSGQKLSYLKQSNRHYSREYAFLELFEKIYAEYGKELKSNDEIDFNDMINIATEHVSSGKFKSKYKYIIIDEFQDISATRFNLLNALLLKNPITKLYCVGDDWQSIYRFAGSDTSFISHYRHFLNPATIVKLDKTFRLNSSINNISSEFVQRNPDQISKNVDPIKQVTDACVKIHWNTKIDESAILNAIFSLNQIEGIENRNLLILSRYNHTLPSGTLLHKLTEAFKGILLEPKSCHRAKGLEADYVIVLDLVSGDNFCFPSEMTNDPILQLVLSEKETYPFAEERRLFYVALTRAKEEVHLITTHNDESIFISEIKNHSEVENISWTGESNQICPACNSGYIIQKKDKFFACTNYPFCKHIPHTCPSCLAGFLKIEESQNEKIVKCSSDTCSYQGLKCSNCNSGTLVERDGKFGKFHSCSNYRTSGCKGSIIKKIA